MASDELIRIEAATACVRERSAMRPEVGIILGTGLGDLSGALETRAVVPYRDIPHFPVSTVESHAGELHLGLLAGRRVAVMKGRVHYYEGYSMRQVAFPVRVLKALGCHTLVITNSVGGMNPNMTPGSIVVTTDHINLMGDNPLIGENDERLGPRFPDMSEPYSRSLIALAEQVAIEQRLSLQRAVFVGVPGPNLETAAEYRFLRWVGADVVGMSLVPENIVAVHGGQRVLALNVVTDACLPDQLRPVDIPEILATAGRTAPALIRLVTEIIRRLESVPDARPSGRTS
ncbi:MAG: purine-nucleoside phosphorylase, partial [Candidatus Eisenbacteria bacterium]|nr:purine-nucleoside phosphorylase [Candidatus Eisenbacteria bacterium]